MGCSFLGGESGLDEHRDGSSASEAEEPSPCPLK